jgi:hypothetical protein
VCWANLHKPTLHDVGCPLYSNIDDCSVAILSIDLHHQPQISRITQLRLDALYVSGSALSVVERETLRKSAHFIYHKSPCKESGGQGRRGSNKRGPIPMTSVGFNFAACNYGRISVYKRQATPIELQRKVWYEDVRYLGCLKLAVSRTMGSSPIMEMTAKAHPPSTYDLGGAPPVLHQICTSVQQTLNVEVWPHVDTNDFDFTLISWSQEGVVRGPFLLHALCVSFTIKVLLSCKLHTQECLFTFILLQDGSMIFLRSRDVVHGTAPVQCVDDGWRIGTACVLNKSLLTAASNSMRNGQGSYWEDEELLAQLNTCTECCLSSGNFQLDLTNMCVVCAGRGWCVRYFTTSSG